MTALIVAEYVIDCSALVDALTGKSATAKTIRQRTRKAQLHAPHVIDAEVGSVLRRQVRANMVTEEAARGYLSALQHTVQERYPHTPFITAAWQLRGNVGFYDALYVALAARLELPLLTIDNKLTNTPNGLPCRVEHIGL